MSLDVNQNLFVYRDPKILTASFALAILFVKNDASMMSFFVQMDMILVAAKMLICVCHEVEIKMATCVIVSVLRNVKSRNSFALAH